MPGSSPGLRLCLDSHEGHRCERDARHDDEYGHYVTIWLPDPDVEYGSYPLQWGHTKRLPGSGPLGPGEM
jgi:hypothetical protein